MYHFMATCAPEPLELSESVHIPGHVRQYLRDFQVETINFLHKHFANREFCISNDDSGLGKCVSTAVYLGAIAKNKRVLIVAQNDDELVTGWQFHFEVLTKLSVGVLAANTSSLDPLPNVIIAKWATLRTNTDVSKYNFDYIIVDNRGEMMNNNFCMSMLLSNYENKVNLIISSADVAPELKLLHNCLRLGGNLEHQYAQFKNFEAKYKLPNFKDVLNKTADLEQYFLKREMISDYCKGFRLRRYRHQLEDQLPLVDVERYHISLELWRTVSSSNSSQRSNDNANNLNTNSETATEELFNQALALDREVSQIIQSRRSLGANVESNEASEEVMSPLLIDSESCSSDEPEVVNIANPEETLNQKKQIEPDIYEFVDLSMDQNSNEYSSTANLDQQILKTNECQTKPRSPTQVVNNQNTSVENQIKKIDNVIELAASQISGKKNNIESLKVALAKKKKTEQCEDCNEKVNDIPAANTPSSQNNQNQSTEKKQTQSTSKNQNELSTKCMPIAVETDTNKKEIVIGTRRRRVNHSEKISEETTKKICATATNKDVSASKAKDLSKPKTKTTLNKRKSGDIEAKDKTSNIGSPAKRSVLNKAEEKVNETANEKPNDNSKKGVANKDQTQSKKDKVESSPRRLRQLRADKSKVKIVDKDTVSPEKSAGDSTVTTNPTRHAVKNVQIKDKNASNYTTTTEKRRQKDSPKSKLRLEIPQTPTSRITRSMQRLTRSADTTKSKYMRASLTLDDSRKQKKRIVKPTGNQEEEDSKSLKASATSECNKNKDKDKLTTEKQHKKKGSSYMGEAIERKKNSANKTECEISVEGEKKTINCVDISTKTLIPKDSSLLPCSQYTEDMQCGQKIVSDAHTDNEFLRPPTPIRFVRNSEHKNFLSTPSSIADSEVVFVPPLEMPNKTQQVVVLSSSTDDGSHSSQQSLQSRRTRALKQKKTCKRSEADRSEPSNAQTSATPTFGELLAKQRIHRKSPEIFTASTDLGLTCTQQRAASGVQDGDNDTFQGFKIFGSEVKQIQQQHAKQQQSGEKRSTQLLSRGRSCLNILDIMFDPLPTNGTEDDAPKQSETTKSKQTSKNKPDARLVKRKAKVSQPVVPILPNLTSTANTAHLQQQPQDDQSTKSMQKQNNIAKNPIITGPMVDEEVFEITNNDAFGSVMRINSNGEISPVQTAIRQQQTQHNKITNYLIGSSTQLTPTEATMEERTPNKRTQLLLSGTVVTRRLPKTKLTQSTKLTKWFQKNDVTENDNYSIAEQNEILSGKQTRSTMAKRLKRRCLELSFKN